MRGAAPAAWKGFAGRLDLTGDLLPVVADIATPIAEYSKLATLGKTPSLIDRRGFACGIAGWTQKVSTPEDIATWSADGRLGICLQTRHVRAIDIDINDDGLSDQVLSAITNALDGVALPMRTRDTAARKLLLFRYDAPMPKRVVPVEGGAIEFLGDGQQAVVAGTHPSGERYSWEGRDAPSSIPTLTDGELQAVWSTLVAMFAKGEPSIARQKREGKELEGVYHDEFADWLVRNWEVYDEGREGQLYMRCPFADGHSTDSGPSSTAYFVAGTGGYERGHVVCLHASCGHRVDEDFIQATGYRAASFKPLPVAVLSDPLVQQVVFGGKSPGLPRNNAGFVDPLAINIGAALAHPPMCRRRIVYDRFRGEVVHYPVDEDGSLPEGENWRPWNDAEYQRMKQRLERVGFRGITKEGLRDAVWLEAMDNEIDTAQIWLSRLRWDGVRRVDTFLTDCFGVEPSAYAEAVSRYIWTALAGRVVEPGCQADMAPVFIGAQGARKTSAVKALVPDRSNYVTINLFNRDTDLSRVLRGKLVGELEELRGLNSKEAEEIKAWITKTEEVWIPKFKESETTFPRRVVLFGSGNDDEFLADATGERRYLPFWVGTHGAISPERIAAEREQLWAEGALLFKLDGVAWEDAEALARVEHHKFKVTDGWAPAVRQWLAETDMTGAPRVRGDVSTADVLTGAIGLPVSQIDARAERRMRKVLTAIGYRQAGEGKLWKK